MCNAYKSFNWKQDLILLGVEEVMIQKVKIYTRRVHKELTVEVLTLSCNKHFVLEMKLKW